jgi:hypothetical protein
MKFKKSYIYLLLLIIVSFFVRLIPHRNMMLATYDEYLHKDITLRLVNEGLGIISTDIYSLLGLEAYSYPPMFHIVGSVLYKIFPSDYTFYIFPAICGALTIYVFYLVSKEILDKKTALLATTLFAFAPNLLYRTSLYIPENLGLFLFTVSLLLFVRYLKYKEKKYIIYLLALMPLYMITHRNWIMFLLSIMCIIVPYLTPYLKKYSKYVMALILLGIVFMFISSNSLITSLIARAPREPVTLVGYFKWMGIIQLIFGILAVNYYIKGNYLKKGLAIWALVFMLIGSVSFRFRDPYASFPLSIMAGEYIMMQMPFLSGLLNNLKESSKHLGRIIKNRSKSIISIFIILLVSLQGVYSVYEYITPPTVDDKEAFDWIIDNTPKNSVFLTWWTTGYTLIGNTHRRDILTWMKVYQGYMGETPSMSEVKLAYRDLVAMFGNHQPEATYSLMKKYNVSYIYLDKKIREYGLIKYGLSEYVAYDTHFKLLFVNGNSEIYQYLPNQSIEPNYNAKINSSELYPNLVLFLEKFWTGYNYADFDDGYKGDYYLNAKISELYYNIYVKTGDTRFKSRSDWILEWLSYEQMDSGAFVDGIPPNEYTLSTAKTIEPIVLNNMNMSEHKKQKSLDFIKDRIKDDHIELTKNEKTKDSYYYIKEAPIIPVAYRLNLLNESTLDTYINDIIEHQNYDGKWGRTVSDTIDVSYSLCEYYYISNDSRVLESINKSADWIMNYQDDNGYFKDEGKYHYSTATYAKSMVIYHVAGKKEEENKMLKIIENNYDPAKETKPLQATLDIMDAFGYIYGKNESLSIMEDLLRDGCW